VCVPIASRVDRQVIHRVIGILYHIAEYTTQFLNRGMRPHRTFGEDDRIAAPIGQRENLIVKTTTSARKKHKNRLVA
jgi:hypothetical protein